MTSLRLCFVGDSITTGTGDAEFAGWPGRLCAAEAARGHDLSLYNLGVRGHTSDQIATRWRAECAQRITDMHDERLVFSFGTNDMAEIPGEGLRVPMDRSLETAKTMIGEAMAWKPTLWIGPVTTLDARQPMSPAPGVEFHFSAERTATLNAAYAELAAEMGAPYLDILTPLSQNPVWEAAQEAYDGTHPVGAGYGELAKLVEDWSAWRGWIDG